MNRFKYNVLLCWFILFTKLFAGDLLVKPSDKSLITSGPRKTATTQFRISNQSADEKEIIISAQLPHGWKQIIPEFPFVMGGNSSSVRLFSFFIPPSTPAGLYEIKYAAQDRKELSRSDETSIQVKVFPVHKIDIFSINFPQYVVEGKNYQIYFKVVNNSNVSDIIELDVQTSEETIAQFDRKTISLNPGEHDSIRVFLVTQLAKSTSKKNHIQIIGSSKAFNKKIHKDYFVEVIPKKQEKVYPFHSLPTKLNLKRVFQQNTKYSTGYQGELYSKGSLDDKNTKKIELRLRGPDIFSQSFLADHDEYFIDYTTSLYKVHLGDGYFALSPLTEKVRYGRGIGTSVNVDKFLLGGYYQQTRWLRDREKQAGAFLRFHPAKNSYVGLNILNIQKNGNASVASLESVLKPNSNNSIELEIASGNSNEKTTRSYRSKLNGELARLTYLFEYIHADPNFPGYYRDTRYFASGVSYNVNQKISLNINIRQEKQNFDIDSTQYSAPISHFEQIGFTIQPFKSAIINLDYVQKSRKDRLEIPKFDYDEQTARLGYSQYFGPLNFYASTEYGNTWNNLTNNTYSMKRSTISATMRFKRKNSVRAYLYVDDNQRYTGEKRQRKTAGISYRQYFKENSYLDFSYQNDYGPEEYYRDRNLFHAHLVHKLPIGHKVSIIGRHTLLRNTLHAKETAVLVDYSIPLKIPVSRKSNKSLIYGKVIDSETSAAIPNMYIQLNNQPVLTDKDGNFSFSDVKTGTHYIYIDESQLEYGKITTPKLPHKIEIVGGKIEYLEILVVRAASINGRIIQAGKSNVLKLLNSELMGNSIALEDIYVELVGPNGTAKRFTDQYGRFYFDGLGPGKYSIIAYKNNLPPYYFFEQNTFELDIKPGENIKINIKALKKERTIIFPTTQENVLTVEENNKHHEKSPD
jgi:hypothetical protein